MKILSIESSCDETAAAVIEDGRKIISSVINTQVAEHGLYGGVVPEIASRRHTENIVGVVEKALDDAQMGLDGVDSIAVTTPPAKTVYREGEDFNPSGMVVTATYTDSTTAPVVLYIVTDGTAMAAGKTSVSRPKRSPASICSTAAPQRTSPA